MATSSDADVYRRRRGRLTVVTVIATLLLMSTSIAVASPVRDAAPVTLPEHPHLYVLGDSWAAGLYADPQETLAQVAAQALGWSVVVNAASGTGYLNDSGTAGQSYPERVASIPKGTTADVVLVQGGSNDDGENRQQFNAAVVTTVAALRARFPTAWIVLLGPGPDPWPVTNEQRAVNSDLAADAKTLRVPYINMLAEQWVTAQNVGTVIDSGTQHPTVAGDAYLGGRLAADLTAMLQRQHDRTGRDGRAHVGG